MLGIFTNAASLRFPPHARDGMGMLDKFKSRFSPAVSTASYIAAWAGLVHEPHMGKAYRTCVRTRIYSRKCTVDVDTKKSHPIYVASACNSVTN